MDTIISANNEILMVMKSIPIDSKGEVEGEDFNHMIMDIVNSKKERNDEENEI